MHETIREEIRSEIQTKNNRINWLLVTQTFIFAAFGIISKFVQDGTNSQEYNLMLKYIPEFGWYLSWLTILGVSGCYIAIFVLNSQYKDSIKDNSDFKILKILVFKDPVSFLIGFFYSYLLCIMFVVLWGMIRSST